MKKTIILSLLAIIATSASAQNNDHADRSAMRAQFIEKRIERLAQKFNLSDDKKAAFADTYKKYCEAMAETMPKCDPANAKKCEKNCEKNCCEQQCKKELTDAEAKQCIQKRLERQEKKIERQQKRLNINKKYAVEFQKVLTPQQTLRVMHFGSHKMHKGGKGMQQMRHGKHGKNICQRPMMYQRGQHPGYMHRNKKGPRD